MVAVPPWQETIVPAAAIAGTVSPGLSPQSSRTRADLRALWHFQESQVCQSTLGLFSHLPPACQ